MQSRLHFVDVFLWDVTATFGCKTWLMRLVEMFLAKEVLEKNGGPEPSDYYLRRIAFQMSPQHNYVNGNLRHPPGASE